MCDFSKYHQKENLLCLFYFKSYGISRNTIFRFVSDPFSETEVGHLFVTYCVSILLLPWLSAARRLSAREDVSLGVARLATMPCNPVQICLLWCSCAISVLVPVLVPVPVGVLNVHALLQEPLPTRPAVKPSLVSCLQRRLHGAIAPFYCPRCSLLVAWGPDMTYTHTLQVISEKKCICCTCRCRTAIPWGILCVTPRPR